MKRARGASGTLRGRSGAAVWLLLAAAGSSRCYEPERADCALACGADGRCPEGMTCSNGRCAEHGRTCRNEEPCQAVEARCAGPDEAQRCDPENGRFVTVETCEPPLMCNAGRCEECRPGTFTCVGQRQRQECAPSGERSPEPRMCSEPFDECQPAGCVSAVKLAAGTAHACVVAPDGGVRCWGANEHGQLGVGDRENRGTAEAAERGRRIRGVELSARRVRHIACGGAHSCVIFDDGRVQCWGKNASGQLGVGDRRDRGVDPDDMGRALPFVDLGRREPIALALGSRHSCALIEGGWVKCWGENDLGQLGLGDTHDRGGEPQQMGAALEYVDLGDEPVIALGAGANHTCAVLAGGSVKCWGANGSGQLGVGDERDRGALPGQMGTALPAVLLRNGRAIDVSAGYLTSCALLEGGAVECWGSNWLAQLGIGRPEIGLGSVPDDVFVPVPLGTGRSAIAVSVGSMHTCALLDDRRVKCWGRNSSGELGVGDARASVGARVEHLGDALASVNLGTQDGTAWLSQGVRSGADFSCALLDGGAVKCWGLNDRGQLGIHQDGDRGTLPEQLGDELPPVALD